MKHKNIFRIIISILMSFLFLFIFSSCAKNDNSLESTNALINKEELKTIISGEYEFIVNDDDILSIIKYMGIEEKIEKLK